MSLMIDQNSRKFQDNCLQQSLQMIIRKEKKIATESTVVHFYKKHRKTLIKLSAAHFKRGFRKC